MKVFQVLSSVSAFATLASSSPVNVNQPATELEPRAESGCYPIISTFCCVPLICLCKDDKIYQINEDSARAENKCNPPWGYIAEFMDKLPGYCCANRGAWWREVPPLQVAEIPDKKRR